MEEALFARIANVVVKIHTDNAMIKNYVLREIEMNLCEKQQEHVDIDVEIIDKAFRPNVDMEQKLENVFVEGKNVFICISAHFRDTWVVIGDINNDCIYTKVYVDFAKASWMKRLLTPNFQYSWQNSLMDFFHGLFLWLLEFLMLQRGATLLHAAVLADEDGANVMIAEAASGKSTLVDALVQRKVFRYIAEDYCIVNSNYEVYGLFNQRRMFANTIKKQGFFDWVNYIMFSCGSKMGIKSIRICSTRELFEEDDILKKSEIAHVFYLNRGNDKMSKEYVGQACRAVMQREIFNWDGCREWFKIYEQLYPEYKGKDVFLERMDKLIGEILNNAEVWNIPFLDTEAEYIEEVMGLLKVTKVKDEEKMNE